MVIKTEKCHGVKQGSKSIRANEPCIVPTERLELLCNVYCSCGTCRNVLRGAFCCISARPSLLCTIDPLISQAFCAIEKWNKKGNRVERVVFCFGKLFNIEKIVKGCKWAIWDFVLDNFCKLLINFLPKNLHNSKICCTFAPFFSLKIIDSK